MIHSQQKLLEASEEGLALLAKYRDRLPGCHVAVQHLQQAVQQVQQDNQPPFHEHAYDVQEIRYKSHGVEGQVLVNNFTGTVQIAVSDSPHTMRAAHVAALSEGLRLLADTVLDDATSLWGLQIAHADRMYLTGSLHRLTPEETARRQWSLEDKLIPVIDEYGESLLDDDGVDPRVARDLAKDILSTIEEHDRDQRGRTDQAGGAADCSPGRRTEDRAGDAPQRAP